MDKASVKQYINSYMEQRRNEQLEKNYQKALKRAEKKGRKLPPRNEYYDHWGYHYASKSERKRLSSARKSVPAKAVPL
jgi:hypothetical protein